MATDIGNTGAHEAHDGPLALRGIRPETLDAILRNSGESSASLTYDGGRLELGPAVLHNIAWPTFEAILNDLGDHRAVRLSYDRGTLRFLPPSTPHEVWKKLIGRMVEMFTFERKIPVRSGGSPTIRRTELAAALEPDGCYWIAHEPAVRGRPNLDFSVDPPPDLAIEIDVGHSSQANMPIYAALGVSEVWRFENGRLTIEVLGSDGSYQLSDESPSLRGLRPADLERYVALWSTMDETSWMYEFRDWVRDEIPTRLLDPTPRPPSA